MAEKKKSSQKSSLKKNVKKSAPKKTNKKIVKSGGTKKSVVKKQAPKKITPARKKLPERPKSVEPVMSPEPVRQASMPAGKPRKSKSKAPVIFILLVAICALGYILKPKILSFISKEKADIIKPSVEKIEPSEIKPAEKIEKPAIEKKEPVKDDGTVYYVVQAKDQLTAISKKFYGTFDRWKEIYEANKNQLTDPTKIHIGQKLIIPGVKK